jgi:hypothetical protein
MKALGDGRYHAKLDDLPESAYRITVQSATPARPIDPVSDWTQPMSFFIRVTCRAGIFPTGAAANTADASLIPAAAGATGLGAVATTAVSNKRVCPKMRSNATTPAVIGAIT